MKNFFRFFVILFTLLLLCSNMNILHAQWVQTNGPNGGSVYSTFLQEEKLFAGTANGVYVSIDNGSNWSQSGLTGKEVTCFSVSGSNFYAGTWGSGVNISTNNGLNWNQISFGWLVFSLSTNGANVIAGTKTTGVFRSIDNGTIWTQANSGFQCSNVNGRSLLYNDGNFYTGISNCGVYISSNAGDNWNIINSGLPDTDCRSLIVVGENIFAGTYGQGIFLSSNNGKNWNAVNSGLTNLYILSFAVRDTNLFAGTDEGGVFLSTNYGTSWNEVNYGLTGRHVNSLTISDDILFAGTQGNISAVWRRPLSEMIVSVENHTTIIPSEFSLGQNFPNPFNPSTTISFDLPAKSFVSLKIFDATGKEVSSLISEELSAGTYSTQWNASGFASGVYFYTLQTGSFIETKKLVLLR